MTPRTYEVRFSERCLKELEKLNKYTKQMIMAWVRKNLQGCSDPKAQGKPLVGDRKGQWRYRIGDYRLICVIEDDKMVILALTAGLRREIYE